MTFDPNQEYACCILCVRGTPKDQCRILARQNAYDVIPRGYRRRVGYTFVGRIWDEDSQGMGEAIWWVYHPIKN